MKKYIYLWLIVCLALAAFPVIPGFSGEDLGPIIRVCLLDDKDSVSLRLDGNYTITTLDSSKVLMKGEFLRAKAQAVKAGIAIGEQQLAVSGVKLNAQKDSDIWIEGRSFRGTVDLIKKDNQKLIAINRVPLDGYLYSVLRHEVSPHWPMEALKAQAIVARTFALYNVRQNKLQLYDLRSDIYSQVYGGSASEKLTTTKAVNLTKDMVLTYKGDIFPTYYHATCAGRTEDAGTLWDVNIQPLKGVACSFCYNSPHYRWTSEISPDEITRKLREDGYKVGKVASISVLSRNKSKRVEKMEIKDEAGTSVVLTGKKFRQMFGPDRIKSTNFYVLRRWQQFIMQGFGWGHGVGMCQWGAYGMSTRGKTAGEILKYYYPGSEISSIDAVANKL
jgi:stage II sporulation protein D